MRVLIVANARSGRGRAVRAAEAARAWLASRAGGGHQVEMFEGGPGSNAAAFETAAQGAGVIVVAGGDGSVHHAAVVAMKVDVPIYHLPCGNENLFAREFGMTRSPRGISEAIVGGRVERLDRGSFHTGGTDRTFVLMASLGPDASVVHRVAAGRTRATGHLAYAGPVAAELWRPHLPRVSVWVDGRNVVHDRQGVLVVANCGRYALGIDPCHRASMSDGKLDVLFMPCGGRWGAARWGWRCWRRSAEAKGAVSGIGREVVVRTGEGVSQVDGEAAGVVEGEATFTVEAGTVPCLVPPSTR